MGFFYLLNREMERRSGVENTPYRGPLFVLALLCCLAVTGVSPLLLGAWFLYLVFTAARLGVGAMAGEETSRDRLNAPAILLLGVKWLVSALPLCLEAVWSVGLAVLVTGRHLSLDSLGWIECLILWYAFIGVYWSIVGGSVPRALVGMYCSVGAILLTAPFVLEHGAPTTWLGGIFLQAVATIGPVGGQPLLLEPAAVPAVCAMLALVPAALAAHCYGYLQTWLLASQACAHPAGCLTPTHFSSRLLFQFLAAPYKGLTRREWSWALLLIGAALWTLVRVLATH